MSGHPHTLSAGNVVLIDADLVEEPGPIPQCSAPRQGRGDGGVLQRIETFFHDSRDDAALIDALRSRRWGAAVLNGTGPGALESLRLVRRHSPLIPVVAVTTDDRSAATLLREGAARVVPAGRWDVLIEAIRREIRAAMLTSEATALRHCASELAARTATLLADVRDPVLVLDARLAVVEVLGDPAPVTGLSGRELVGRRLDELAVEADRLRVRQALQAAGPALHCRFEPRPGQMVTVEMRVRDERDTLSVGGLTVTLVEMTEADELRHRASHDALTGLPTRATLLERVELAMARMRRHQTTTAVLFVDLDGFKAVNDTMGHEAGDELLIEVAARFRDTLRATDLVARFGGDEFVVLVEEVRSAGDAELVGSKLLAALADPIPLAAGMARVGASIGVAVTSDPGTEPEALLADADAAMYHVKASGKNGVRLFDNLLRSVADDRRELSTRLASELGIDELSVSWSPIVGVDEGQVCGFEARLSWDHPRRGRLPARDWLSLADEAGQRERIEAWRLGRVAAQIMAWRQPHHGDLIGWIPMAGPILSGDALPCLLEQLAEGGVPIETLGILADEASAVRRPDETRATLNRLRELGVRTGLDEFGAAGLSPHLLQELPLDALRLHSSYTAALGTSIRSARTLAGIVSMARHLGIEVTATGIDNATHLTSIVQLRCQQAQGLLFADDIGVDQATALLAPDHRWQLGQAPAGTPSADPMANDSIEGLGSRARRRSGETEALR